MGKCLRLIALSFTALLSLGACTSSAEEETTDLKTTNLAEEQAVESDEEISLPNEPSLATYKDVSDLVDAAVEGGYECGNFARLAGTTWGESSGWCRASDASVFTVYATESDLESQIDLWVQGERGFEVLIGDKWTIRESKSTLNFLQNYLGGEIRIEEEGDPKSLSAQSVITPEDPNLTPIFSDWFDRVSGDHGRPVNVTGHRIGGDSDTIEMWVQWNDTDWGQAGKQARDAYEDLGTSLALLVHYASEPNEPEIYDPQVAEVFEVKFFDHEGVLIGKWNPSFVAAAELDY